MRAAETINAGFFLFMTFLAWVRALDTRRRLRITGLGAAGLVLCLAGAVSRQQVVRDWLPVPLMLLAYWQSGPFFLRPNEELQSWLLRLDTKLLGGLPGSLRRGYPAAWFELAYLFCYPLVPVGLGCLYLTGRSGAVDHYWAAVLLPTYVCYALLPFLPTLPPWAVATERTGRGGTLQGSEEKDDAALRCARFPGEQAEALPRTGVRRLNLWLNRKGSIHVNTFPSAHVATTMAGALVLLTLVPPVGVIFLIVAMSIAAGAVLGRYHYAADAIAGALLAAAAVLGTAALWPS